MRVYGWNCLEISHVDLNMSMRAVKEKESKRRACMRVCCIWKTKGQRLRVKLTAARPVEGQRAQTNLMEVYLPYWAALSSSPLLDSHFLSFCCCCCSLQSFSQHRHRKWILARLWWRWELLVDVCRYNCLSSQHTAKVYECQSNTHNIGGALPHWATVGVVGRHGANVPSDYGQGTGEAH